MSGFANQIVGGSSTLERQAIKSPNYSAGSAGWTINKDGSAEFNNATFRGTVVISSGGQSLFVYSGTPAAGNLILSIAAAAGTDAFGNGYPRGLQAVSGIQMLPADNAFDSYALVEALYNVSTSFGQLFMSSPYSAAGGQVPASLTLNSTDGTGKTSALLVADTTTVTGPIRASDTWHAPAYGANWAGSTTFNGVGRPTLQYRIDAEDNVWLFGAFKAGGTLPANPVFTLPAGWRPAAAGNIFIQRNNGGTLSTGTCFISASGNVDLFAGDGMGIAINNEYYVNGKVPLGNLT